MKDRDYTTVELWVTVGLIGWLWIWVVIEAIRGMVTR
jgi:hypothetical protein